MSEIYGRRIVLVCTQLIYTLFILGQLFAGHSAACLLTTRFFSGLFAAAPLTIGGGVMADLFEPYTRGYASTLFSVAVSLGPCLGPVVGTYLNYDAGWRAIFWFLFALGITSWLLAIVLLPETYPPILLSRKARNRRIAEHSELYFAPHDKCDFSIKEIFTRTVFRPL
jgi:DHA1 family multidrug resistance protein-like MFS transporter